MHCQCGLAEWNKNSTSVSSLSFFAQRETDERVSQSIALLEPLLEAELKALVKSDPGVHQKHQLHVKLLLFKKGSSTWGSMET